jgi:hypothetical protein
MPTPFAWDDVCTTIVSMPSSRAQRSAVIAQLAREGITDRVTVSPGVVLSADTIEQVVGDATRSCVVPATYLNNITGVSKRWFGTIGSSLAHLNLLHRFASGRLHLEVQVGNAAPGRRQSKERSCSWLMVLADDVVLLPGFADFVQKRIFSKLDSVDFVNLAVVRAWGEPDYVSPDGMAIKRVSGSMMWPAWSMGRHSADAIVKSPNLLVSGYLVRTATLPMLLKGFGLARDFRPQCSIDQVLARIQYALASSGQYRSFNIEADERSMLAHCAVGPNEKILFQERYPARHRACLENHQEIYGGGSRSHDRRRRLSDEDHLVSLRPDLVSLRPDEVHRQPHARRAVSAGAHARGASTPKHTNRLQPSGAGDGTSAGMSRQLRLELMKNKTKFRHLADAPTKFRLKSDSRGGTAGGACFHCFQVPGDRVLVNSNGKLVTRPLSPGVVRDVAEEWPSSCGSMRT